MAWRCVYRGVAPHAEHKRRGPHLPPACAPGRAPLACLRPVVDPLATRAPPMAARYPARRPEEQRRHRQGKIMPHDEGRARGMGAVTRRDVASQSVTVSTGICASSRLHAAITSRLKAWWRSHARRKQRPATQGTVSPR